MSIDATIREYVDAAVEKAVEAALTKQQNQPEETHRNEKPQIIRGISGLAKFLGVSTPTAQKLKNQNKIPYRQTGRVLIFLVDEVLAAMKKR
jgi:hypothetical protein